MCGRYTLIKLAEFTDLFPWMRPAIAPVPPRYNIAPSQPVAVVSNDEKYQIDFYRWGLVPSWAKDPAIGNRLINARAETLVSKPAFRAALRRRRCLILADGFYEWQRHPDGKTKTPMYIRLKMGKPFAFAGLWESWHSADGSELPTCTIITCEPNELMKPIHNRMPVILRREHYTEWLDPAEMDPTFAGMRAAAVLTPYPAEEMEAYAVGRRVNNPKVDAPDCILPVDAPPDTTALRVSAGAPAQQRPIQEPGLFD